MRHARLLSLGSLDGAPQPGPTGEAITEGWHGSGMVPMPLLRRGEYVDGGSRSSSDWVDTRLLSRRTSR